MKMNRRGRLVAAMSACASLSAVLVAVPAQVQAATATLSMDMRVLVLSANGHEPAIEAWKAELTAEGVPFDTVVTSTAPPIDATLLTSGENHGRYQAVVVANPELISCDADPCASTVTTEELTTLKSFETKFGVRQVDAYTYPTPAVGLNYPSAAGDMHGVVASLSTSGAAAFPYLVGPVPIEHSYGYLATPAPGPGATFDPLVIAPSGEPLVGVHRSADTSEEMVVTVDTNPSTLHARLLLQGMLRWVTKG
ncbi:MAG: hypothetical protein HYZ59_03535, partial [Actinobacteria bacterium]|nr:hypothetical protein [Actinomycetota bacterium]